MPRKLEAYTNEVLSAIAAIENFVSSVSFESYTRDEKTKSAVERKLLTIGEALNQMTKVDSSLEAKITDLKKIVAFRNILVHGYFGIDDQIVWSVVSEKLKRLRSEIENL